MKHLFTAWFRVWSNQFPASVVEVATLLPRALRRLPSPSKRSSLMSAKASFDSSLHIGFMQRLSGFHLRWMLLGTLDGICIPCYIFYFEIYIIYSFIGSTCSHVYLHWKKTWNVNMQHNKQNQQLMIWYMENLSLDTCLTMSFEILFCSTHPDSRVSM